MHTTPTLPGLRESFDDAWSLEIRQASGEHIRACNARSTPGTAARFALLVHDDDGSLRAGLVERPVRRFNKSGY